MKQFLNQLFATGQVTVPPAGETFEAVGRAREEILQFDRAARLGLAGEAPELDLAVAGWAAGLLAEAARLAVARELGPQEVEQVFARACPKPRAATVDYSADLFLRYLPGLLDWVQRLSPEDPLLEQLRLVGALWPLSSVGMRGLSVTMIEPFIEHPALRQLYVDRILATGDTGRLNDPRVAEAARVALGAHPELSEAVAKAVGLVA